MALTNAAFRHQSHPHTIGKVSRSTIHRLTPELRAEAKGRGQLLPVPSSRRQWSAPGWSAGLPCVPAANRRRKLAVRRSIRVSNQTSSPTLRADGVGSCQHWTCRRTTSADSGHGSRSEKPAAGVVAVVEAAEGGGGLTIQGLLIVKRPPWARITAPRSEQGRTGLADCARRERRQHQESSGAEGSDDSRTGRQGRASWRRRSHWRGRFPGIDASPSRCHVAAPPNKATGQGEVMVVYRSGPADRHDETR